MSFLRSILLAFLMMPVLFIHGQRRDGYAMIDSTVIGDVLRVKQDGGIYTGFLKPDSFYVLDKRGHIVLRLRNEYYSSCVFRDYDGDGYKDLLLEIGSNTPGLMDVYLYRPSHGFQKLKDGREFPAPERIKGTPYYYSYHHSGCADEDWDSDLFYIRNGAAVCLGNISGQRCAIDNGIYISKVRAGKKRLVQKLPLQTIHRYKGDKWEFIEVYWKKYYRRYI